MSANRVAHMEPPVEYLYGNLVVAPPHGESRTCWAAYELAPVHFDFMTADKQAAYHADLSRLFIEFQDVAEAHLAVVPERSRARDTLLREVKSAKTPEAADYCNQVAEVMGEVDERDDAGRFRTFLYVRLPNQTQAYASMAAWAKAHLLKWRDALEALAGVTTSEIEEQQMATWLAAEQTLRGRLEAFAASTMALRFRPLTAPELLVRIRSPFWRSLGASPLSAGWMPGETVTHRRGQVLIKPDASAMRRLYGGRIDHQEEAGYLKVTQMEDGKPRHAYQSFLTVEQFSMTPIALQGSEWAYQLQQAAGPVELHLHWTPREYERTLRDLASRKRIQADTAEQEQEHAGGTSADTFRTQGEIEEMESYVKESRSPTLLTSIVIVVSATSTQMLQSRIAAAYSVFRRLDIKLAHNGCDQYKHFIETMPAAPRLVEDYTHRLLPITVATGMIGTTSDLLDRVGIFLAVDNRGRPLFWDPTRALMVLDTSGSIAFLGPMGTGKSLTANLMAYLAALVRGAKILAIDSAKPERGRWPQLLPYLGSRTRVVTLSNHVADRGKLDPYTIFSNREEATNHAISLAAFLTQTPLNEVGYDVLLRAFLTMQDREETPCMMAGIRYLEQLANDAGYEYRKVAKRLAERLQNLSRMAYANLLFGDGTGEAIDTTQQITVLQLDRIQRPPDNKAVKDYTLNEYISHAILESAVAFAHAFANQDRRQQKVIVADEIRWFVNSAHGRDLIEQQTLIGRAMGTQVFLIGQNVSHLPEDLHQHFTMRFAFGAANEAEAVATLQFLGAEATPANVDCLLRLNPGGTKGQCMLRDMAGHIGLAQIQPLFDQLTEAFNTQSLTPGDQANQIAEEVVV